MECIFDDRIFYGVDSIDMKIFSSWPSSESIENINCINHLDSDVSFKSHARQCSSLELRIPIGNATEFKFVFIF